jgi:transcriptional regulator with XRE-family HTH domain
MDDETFATALRVARDRMGLTREEFGDGLRVSGTTIQKWEGGEVFPKPARWKAILDFCGLDPSLYKDYSTTIDNSDQATASYNSVAASGGSTVTLKPDINLHEPIIPTELSAKEWEALQAIRHFGDIALDVIILFGQYGSRARLMGCHNDLICERERMSKFT